MPVKDCKTEHIIKTTAERIFLSEGKLLATTQDIADAAGVNRTLLHYYFRSRDALFNIVFIEALTKMRSDLHQVIGSQQGFKDKINNFLNVFFLQLEKTPFLETYIVVQLNQEPEKFSQYFVPLTGGRERLDSFFEEIKIEIDKGTIKALSPHHFFIDLLGMMTYPYVARPLLHHLLNLQDQDFNSLLQHRKQAILRLLFNDT